jgi:hypothetical protein
MILPAACPHSVVKDEHDVRKLKICCFEVCVSERIGDEGESDATMLGGMIGMLR